MGWCTQAEDLRPARGAVHRVHDVVEIGGKLVNVFAVERRDESAVETVDDFVRHLIGFVLQPFERLDVRRTAVGGGFEQFPQVICGFLVAVGDFGEQIEKLFFARQETHGISGGPGGPQR